MAIENYLFQGMPDPTAKLMQGLQAGNAFAELGAMQKMRELERVQKQAEIANAQKMREDLLALSNAPTLEGVQSFMLRNPQMAEKMKPTVEFMQSNLKNRIFSDATQAMAAIKSGNTQNAVDLLNASADTFEKSNQVQQAQNYRNFAKAVEKSPQEGLGIMTVMLSQSMDAKEFANTLKSMNEIKNTNEQQPFTVRKAEAEAIEAEVKADNAQAKITADIGLTEAQTQEARAKISREAKRLALDEKELRLKQQELDQNYETKLEELRQKRYGMIHNEQSNKLINDSVVQSVTLSSAGDSANALAKRFEDFALQQKQSGVIAKGAEWFKRQAGGQDALTLLKKDYLKIRMSEALKLLPQGPATDRDVGLVLETTIDENASPETLARYARGMAKINKILAKVEEAKAEWVNSVGSLSKARDDIEVLGVKVPKGSSFIDYQKQFVKKMASKEYQDSVANMNAEVDAEALKNRSYLEFDK